MRAGGRTSSMDISLFFFSADGSGTAANKYQLFIDTVQFADRNGFTAVWIPERHFDPFGGLYPNPSVLGAAMAMVTKRLQIRAGSVVIPIQDPLPGRGGVVGYRQSFWRPGWFGVRFRLACQ